MFVATLLACILAYWLAPDFRHRPVRILTIGLGYAALVYLALTLLIGPWQLIVQARKRSPVNSYLRRDIGIWTAIAGILHVFFGIQVHLIGRPWLYFLEEGASGFRVRLNLFGVSNYVGLFATLVLLLLLLISNDLALRKLKGRWWKFLQRFNYALFLLVVAHTFGYQLVAERSIFLVSSTIGLVMLVLALQTVGFYLYRTRMKQKPAGLK